MRFASSDVTRPTSRRDRLDRGWTGVISAVTQPAIPASPPALDAAIHNRTAMVNTRGDGGHALARRYGLDRGIAGVSSAIAELTGTVIAPALNPASDHRTAMALTHGDGGGDAPSRDRLNRGGTRVG